MQVMLTRAFQPVPACKGRPLPVRHAGRRAGRGAICASAASASNGDAGADFIHQLKGLSASQASAPGASGAPPVAQNASSSSSGSGCGGGCSSGSHLSSSEKEARMLTSGLIEKMNEMLPTTLSREDMRAAFAANGAANVQEGAGEERFWSCVNGVLSSSGLLLEEDPDAELDSLVV